MGRYKKWGDKLKKNILMQYADMKEEIKDIRKRIEKTKDKIKFIEKGGTVFDVVSGTRRDGTFGSIKIEGFPKREYNKQVDALKRYLTVLETAETKEIQILTEIEEYINSIEDTRMRMIIRYRIIDDMPWKEIASRIGGKNTEDSIRKAFERFIEK